MQLDHPLVRKSGVCPVCTLPKGDGLVVCWSCYGTHNLRNGNTAVDKILDVTEEHLVLAQKLHEAATICRMRRAGTLNR